MKLGASTATTVLAAVVLAASVGAAGAAASGAGKVLPRLACGPKAETLVATANARVYRVQPEGSASQVFGCVPGFRPQRLDQPRSPEPEGGPREQPWILDDLVALNGTWAAYLEHFVRVDVGVDAVGIVNLRSGTRRHCPIGGWSANSGAGFRMARIVATSTGSAAWIGVEVDLRNRTREVHACEGARRRLLDEGAGIDLRSLRLDGHILSWTDAGEARSAQLK